VSDTTEALVLFIINPPNQFNNFIGVFLNIGKVTSKESSTGDYFIVGSELFSFITQFIIIDFDPLFSDVHCRIQVSISCSESSMECPL
jgi:hypothetical protein